jgi:hypothetical protein
MHCFNVGKLSFNRKLSHSHKHRPQKWRFWWQWTFQVDELYIAENSNSFCYITPLRFSWSHTGFPLRPRFTEVCYWFSFQTNLLKFIWNSTTITWIMVELEIPILVIIQPFSIYNKPLSNCAYLYVDQDTVLPSTIIVEFCVGACMVIYKIFSNPHLLL